jgi:hypothetical protein
VAVKGNLVPDKRRDVNGRLVTRYVKPHAHTTALFDIPAPTDKFGEPKLDEAQLESWEIGLSRSGFIPDAELHAILKNNVGLYDLVTNDAEVYGMLSVLEPKDAIPLMNDGIRTPEEVIGFLRKHNLIRLQVDRSAHVKEALSRHLSAHSYLKVYESKNIRNVPLARVLNGVETYAMGLPHSYDFHGDVLRGHISVEDIRTIGAELIGSNAAPIDIRELLWDIKSGAANFDAAQFKLLIEAADKSDCSIANADDLVFKFGVDDTLKFNNISDAFRMMDYLDRDNTVGIGMGTPQMLSLVRYYDEMCRFRNLADHNPEDLNQERVISLDRAIELYGAGIDPKSAWEGIDQRMTLQQIIAVKQHDVPPSVSEGWL